MIHKYLIVLLMLLTYFSHGFAQKGKKTVGLTNNDTAQVDEYFGGSFLRFDDFVYDKNIKTSMLYRNGWPLSSPIMELHTGEELKLSFDDLSQEIRSYYYTVKHCSKNWEETDIMEMDYVDGFMENEITDYRYSVNTLQEYTHFNLVFPNEDMRIKLSGNYLLIVYADGNKENLVLTKRFMVVEPRVNVIPVVKRATLLDDRNYKQEIDFTIMHEGYMISDPYGEIYVVITQNNRWDNAIRGLQPVFIRSDELIYDYDRENVFTAGNEFRQFSIRSFRYRSEKVAANIVDSAYNHVHLLPDQRRSFLKYSTQSDINGRFFIKNEEGNDAEVDADYAYVYFTLPYDAPMINGDIYLLGDLNNWVLNKTSKMDYNYDKKSYQKRLMLKQGYYEYQYVYKEDGHAAGDETLVEGSHYDTENEYTIYVYDSSLRNNYDRLIAVKKFGTRY
ncbi:MAG: DUF5103 domain-containing protein [Bacteroidetes bacterium]|nr:MAG: DUF5103 domain-containing protein [Bacteroidota bacterium]